MNRRLEEEFEAIIGKAMDDAANVKCPLANYIEGLEIMLEELQENRLSLAKDELKDEEE